ncbi:hypothetical protein [Streptomyces sp. NPDC054863]
MVVLALVVGVGTAWFLQRDTGKSPAGSAGSPQTSASSSALPVTPDTEGTGSTDGTGSTGSTGSTDSTDEPTAPGDRPIGPGPEGFSVIPDESGIILAVPSGWQRSEPKSTVVFYRPAEEPKGRQGMHYLQFWPISEQNISSMDALRVTLSDNLGEPGFERIRLRELPGEPLAESAELVYAYDSAEVGRRMQVVERVFRAEDGRQYAFVSAAPVGEWPQQYRTLATVLRYFAVPGAEAP